MTARIAGVALRLLAGGALAWMVALALAAPELPVISRLAAGAIAAVTVWKPGAGLLLLAGLAPAAALFAASPGRPAELFAWSFLAAWLVRVWRPLSPRARPQRLAVPAALFAAAAGASWLGLALRDAGGVAPGALPQHILRSIPLDYLVFSSPEPQTWAMLQLLTGLATLVATTGIVADSAELRRGLAWAVVTSLAIMSIATSADVVRQWADVGYGAWFLARYVEGERFSLHLRDLNAAGSLYVLAALIAIALAVLDRSRRVAWALLAIVMMPALWLAGSRSSFVALISGLAIFGALHSRWTPTRVQAVAAGSLLVAALFTTALLADWRTDVRGSAGRAVNLRSQFSRTTTAMFSSAPAYGVGVGKYFDRSAEFMSEELRALYGNENAHNYFAQQFAELGAVGGALFIWLIVAGLARGWGHARASADGTATALLVGSAGYLLTCLTGHPLLVPEAALPFWIVFGAVAGGGPVERAASPHLRAAAVAVLAVVGIGLAGSAAAYSPPPSDTHDQGFHGMETGADGVTFRWMTRHGITYIPDGPGFLRLRLQAPNRGDRRPVAVETSVAGRALDRREIPPGVWVAYDVPVRRVGPAPRRRVDLRVNQVWMEEVELGRRRAQRPIAVMVSEVRWMPIR